MIRRWEIIKSKVLFISSILSCIIILITVAIVKINYELDTIDIASNQIVSEYTSPNGKYKAVLFIRDAGATTKESYQLSILKVGEKIKNESGNVLITYSKFEVDWEDNETLLIKFHEDEDIFKQKEKSGNIQVKYEKIKAGKK